MQQYLPLGSVVSLKNNEDNQKIINNKSCTNFRNK